MKPFRSLRKRQTAMVIRLPLTRPNGVDNKCLQCLRALSKSASPTAKRHISNTLTSKTAIITSLPHRRLTPRYFLANAFTEKGAQKGLLECTSSTENSGIGHREFDSTPASHVEVPQTQELPHRRRQRAKKQAANPNFLPVEPVIPLDASASLSSLAQLLPTSSFRRLFSICLSLSKPRLSFLVVLTATASYAVFPVPDLLSPSLTETPSLSTLTLFFLSTGTFLAAASANTFNMLYEPKWDAMMSRTKNRPLVRGLISTRGAMIFAIGSGIVGLTALYYGVNPTVSFLGGLNIILYAAAYTPLKRISVINTWVGAIVGGIPPLMGWAAAAGQIATGLGGWQELLFSTQSIGGWLLAGILFAWQFPHFMSLSFMIRDDYKNAGYKMLSWVNPNRNGRVALRYALVMIPLSVGLCYVGVTEWAFAVTSVPLNAWMIWEAGRFWWLEGAKGSARGLFWASVWHLPVLMAMATLEKKGMWARIWRAVAGEGQPDGDDDWVYEDEEEPVVPADSLVVQPVQKSAVVVSKK